MGKLQYLYGTARSLQGKRGRCSSRLSNYSRIASLLLTIISFAAIIFLLRVVLSLVGRAFSHRYHGGFAGVMDWLLGLLLGVITGVIYVFVFLALVVPAVGLFMPEHCETVMGWLDSSVFAGDLYNNNLLLVLFRDFL